MPENTTVSVVIPCYNGAKFLRETLGSALAQTLPPLEILVIDDGSTDDSADLARSYGPPVRVISQENQGESFARNRGIEEAKGEWVAFLDADDLWMPEKLASQVRAIGPGIIAACCGSYVTSHFPLDTARAEVWLPRREGMTAEEIISGTQNVHISGLMVSRKAAARFPTWTRYSEDLIYQLELVQEGEIAIVPDPLVIYRVHAASQCRTTIDAICRSHASLAKWVTDNRDALGPERTRRYLDVLAAKLRDGAKGSVYRRDWKQLELIQDYVRSQDEISTSEEIMRMPKYNKFVYKIRDGIRHFRHKYAPKAVAREG